MKKRWAYLFQNINGKWCEKNSESNSSISLYLVERGIEQKVVDSLMEAIRYYPEKRAIKIIKYLITVGMK